MEKPLVNKEIKETIAESVRRITTQEIPFLLRILPSDCFHKYEFSRLGSLWLFDFKCNFAQGKFFACAIGKTPAEAYQMVKDRIIMQVHEWHKTRFVDIGSLHKTFQKSNPRILLVDDDEDLTLAMHTAFNKLGWHTDVVLHHEGLHRKIASSDADYILLDWKLNGSVTADRVFEKTIRLIDAFSDLRDKFSEHKPQIVTYSALNREQINLPLAGEQYFKYLDHWQKPIPCTEIAARLNELATARQGAQ